MHYLGAVKELPSRARSTQNVTLSSSGGKSRTRWGESRGKMQLQKREGGARLQIASSSGFFNSFPLSLSLFLSRPAPSLFSLFSLHPTHRAVSMFFAPSSKMEAMDCLFSSLAGASSAALFFSAAAATQRILTFLSKKKRKQKHLWTLCYKKKRNISLKRNEQLKRKEEISEFTHQES